MDGEYFTETSDIVRKFNFYNGTVKDRPMFKGAVIGKFGKISVFQRYTYLLRKELRPNYWDSGLIELIFEVIGLQQKMNLIKNEGCLIIPPDILLNMIDCVGEVDDKKMQVRIKKNLNLEKNRHILSLLNIGLHWVTVLLG